MVKKSIIYIFIYTLLVGCDIQNVLTNNDLTNDTCESDCFLEISAPSLQMDENGYYHFTYPMGSNSSYGRVYCETLPTQRVYWTSPNSFNTYYQKQWFSTPNIQYSTYTSSDGIGQQLFYLYEQFVGDTLIIMGGLSEDNWDYVEIVID